MHIAYNYDLMVKLYKIQKKKSIVKINKINRIMYTETVDNTTAYKTDSTLVDNQT